MQEKTKSGRHLKSKFSAKYRPTPPPVLSLGADCGQNYNLKYRYDAMSLEARSQLYQ